MTFDDFFRRATGQKPYAYQRELATADKLHAFVDVPTGLGKTAAIVLAWLWRRRFTEDEVRHSTPRRLAYCLPMRVLVEQTRDNAVLWLDRLGLLGGLAKPGSGDRVESYALSWEDAGKVPVAVLMGGEDEDDWDAYPERDAILVGTQDMLISRVLNRGYAVSRARWPMKFGLLNTDCLWVFDEVQLMGAGLATTSQMEAFRRLLPSRGSQAATDGHGCQSVWMSATLKKDWLKTVDFDPKNEPELKFDPKKEKEGLERGTWRSLEARWSAKKRLAKAEASMGDASGLANEILDAHQPGTRTIVVVNTVRRACDLFKALNDKGPDGPRRVLLHSRFRPEDRKKRVEEALAEIKPNEPGTIVVSTQVIEAGVDVSARTLFTEIAPWASLVQRFGRCNRRGEYDEAKVFWIDLPGKEADGEELAPPYEPSDLKASWEALQGLKDVGLKALPKAKLPFEHTHVIRRKDLIDLFDTTPDLAGNDIDIDRFVREVEESDIRIFWRDWVQPRGCEPPPEDQVPPRREELCAAPIGSKKNPGFRAFVKKHGGKIWRWSFLDGKWERADAAGIAPGQVFLVHADAGGYSAERGWDLDGTGPVQPVGPRTNGDRTDASEDDRLSHIVVWQAITEHTEEVCSAMDGIVKALSITGPDAEALRLAARWHDRGKAHEVFQDAIIDDGQGVASKGQTTQRRERPEKWRGCRSVAKAPDGFWRRYERKHFRHELASAIAVLLGPESVIPADARDLVAYLVAAHHGKVRLSIRSLPNESHPGDGRRFARGIWDGDKLPATDLGGGVTAPTVPLSLEPMELGLCEEAPFAGQPSWAERMIRVREAFGPFRLAYLEAILRAADWRASRKAETT